MARLVHLCLSAFTAHPIHLGSCRVTRQAGRAHTKGPEISVESIYRDRCSISRKTAVADPRTGERVAQLAQGREEMEVNRSNRDNDDADAYEAIIVV